MRNMLAVMSIAVAVCAVSWAETGEDLYMAVNEGNRGLVEKILKSGVDVNYSRGNGWRPVNQACLNGDLPMVELLVSKGASLSMTNKGAWFPLLAAVSSGNRDLVEYLCSRPECEVQAGSVGHNGWTPYTLAASMGRVDILQVMDARFSVTVPLHPLEEAAIGGDVATIRYLLEREIWGYSRVSRVDTAAILAARHANADALDTLVMAGAKLNVRDTEGKTALLVAVTYRDTNGDGADDRDPTRLLQTIRVLLTSNADPNAVDSKGESVLAHARQLNDKEIIALLQKAGAR